jgi:hypothetical protein
MGYVTHTTNLLAIYKIAEHDSTNFCKISKQSLWSYFYFVTWNLIAFFDKVAANSFVSFFLGCICVTTNKSHLFFCVGRRLHNFVGVSFRILK